MPSIKQNLYLFYGPDTFSAHEKLVHWQKEFEKKYGDLNLQNFDGETINTEQLKEAMNTLPFLSDKKLLIVKNFLRDIGTDEQKKTAEVLEDLPDHCLLVFIEDEEPDARTTLFKTLKKLGHAIQFPSLNPLQLDDWIQKRVNLKKGTIDRKEIRLLAEKIGPNLWQLEQDLEKLLLFSGNQTISEKAIDELVTPNIATSIFKLTDAIAQKNNRQSLQILQDLIWSGEDLMQILYMMARHIRVLIQVKVCLEQKLNKAQITEKLKEHPYTIQNAMQQSKNFTLEQLKAIYQAILNTDIQLKSGKIRISTEDQKELRLAIEKLILKSST